MLVNSVKTKVIGPKYERVILLRPQTVHITRKLTTSTALFVKLGKAKKSP